MLRVSPFWEVLNSHNQGFLPFPSFLWAFTSYEGVFVFYHNLIGFIIIKSHLLHEGLCHPHHSPPVVIRDLQVIGLFVFQCTPERERLSASLASEDDSTACIHSHPFRLHVGRRPSKFVVCSNRSIVRSWYFDSTTPLTTPLTSPPQCQKHNISLGTNAWLRSPPNVVIA